LVCEKNAIFSPNIFKNRKKCDHNIDPWSPCFQSDRLVFAAHHGIPVSASGHVHADDGGRVGPGAQELFPVARKAAPGKGSGFHGRGIDFMNLIFGPKNFPANFYSQASH
jgi:hypothetical protein